jgi:hypothetical protein
VDTTRSLQDRSYAPSRSLCFVARQPKAREIHAADFLDRVVHHVLVPRLEALFEPVFIHDLYSNRVGKGTHAAVERLGGFMRAVSDNGLAGFARAYVTTTSLRLPPAARERLRAILASYLGHFAHADAWRLSQSLFAPPGWLGRLFEWHQGRLVPRWEPAAVTSLRSQVQYFRHQFPPALVLVQVGNRVALFGPDLRQALAACPWLARWRDVQVETRGGLGQGLSWSLAAIQGLGRSLRAAGLAYAFVAEEGYLRGGMKRRVLRFLYSPLATGPVRFQENAGRQA